MDCSRSFSVSSGKVLDAPWQSANQQAFVGQYSDNGGRNQLWQLQDLGNRYTKIVPAMSPSFALDVPDGSHDAGVFIQQFSDNGGGANQQWELIPVQ
jgi:hypothetical protein